MDLIEDPDPEEARTIVDPALKLTMEAAQRYGGYVVQSTGDGIFALFGAPVAHEDHPPAPCSQHCGCSRRSGATRTSCAPIRA
jgi:class 3 adenylate cyclase